MAAWAEAQFKPLGCAHGIRFIDGGAFSFAKRIDESEVVRGADKRLHFEGLQTAATASIGTADEESPGSHCAARVLRETAAADGARVAGADHVRRVARHTHLAEAKLGERRERERLVANAALTEVRGHGRKHLRGSSFKKKNKIKNRNWILKDDYRRSQRQKKALK